MFLEVDFIIYNESQVFKATDLFDLLTLNVGCLSPDMLWWYCLCCVIQLQCHQHICIR